MYTEDCQFTHQMPCTRNDFHTQHYSHGCEPHLGQPQTNTASGTAFCRTMHGHRCSQKQRAMMSAQILPMTIQFDLNSKRHGEEAKHGQQPSRSHGSWPRVQGCQDRTVHLTTHPCASAGQPGQEVENCTRHRLANIIPRYIFLTSVLTGGDSWLQCSCPEHLCN